MNMPLKNFFEEAGHSLNRDKEQKYVYKMFYYIFSGNRTGWKSEWLVSWQIVEKSQTMACIGEFYVVHYVQIYL